ncbi:MAG: PilZ domain-containing protein [Candidatus Omnitrophica bacterium]|nr:PilZ domain-containing protein [Candidatus Omnitrophota bacterium]MCK5393963.1 PilZ domain-containing protein [Candidatus Omnitrophota bacterium]MCK5494134.1 PilZ domain-containing protein [Candidatus Omnitrophota bacterium]
MEERRHYVRINDDIKISYQIQKILGMITSVSANLSVCGLKLPVLHNVHPGIHLRLEFSLSGVGKLIVLDSVVQWIKETKGSRFPFEVGLKFINLDPKDKKIIISYIDNKKDRREIQWLD